LAQAGPLLHTGAAESQSVGAQAAWPRQRAQASDFGGLGSGSLPGRRAAWQGCIQAQDAQAPNGKPIHLPEEILLDIFHCLRFVRTKMDTMKPGGRNCMHTNNLPWGSWTAVQAQLAKVEREVP